MKFTKREVVQSEGSSLFLKLKDGDSITGIFRGENHEFHVKWENGKSHLTNEHDQEGKPRFRLNFITKEDKRLVAKIWEFSVVVYNQLADLNEEYPLETTKVKITRRGSGTDTVYSILPLLKEPLTPAQIKEIESVSLNMLEHKQ